MAKARPKPTPSTNGAAHEVLTLAEAAAFLRVGEDGLRADAEAGRVPAKQVAGEWRFFKQGLMEWLAEEPRRLHSRPPAGVGAAYTDEDPEEVIAAIQRERKKYPVGG